MVLPKNHFYHGSEKGRISLQRVWENMVLPKNHFYHGSEKGTTVCAEEHEADGVARGC
jgi:hypothetical protein